MIGKYSAQCFYTFLSGFFFAPAFGQLLRIIFGWSMTIGAMEITATCSLVIIVISLALSAFFMWMSCKRCGSDSC